MTFCLFYSPESHERAFYKFLFFRREQNLQKFSLSPSLRPKRFRLMQSTETSDPTLLLSSDFEEELLPLAEEDEEMMEEKSEEVNLMRLVEAN